jgi:hypothetical protein
MPHLKKEKVKASPRGGGDLAACNPAKKRFNDLVVESFLESMDFGEVVLRFLELKSAVKRGEIAEKPEKFAKELEDLLGDSAKIIEEKMTQRLYAKTGMDYVKKEGYAFSDYIKDAYRKQLRLTPSTSK